MASPAQATITVNVADASQMRAIIKAAQAVVQCYYVRTQAQQQPRSVERTEQTIWAQLALHAAVECLEGVLSSDTSPRALEDDPLADCTRAAL